jgi:hypothetical protein
MSALADEILADALAKRAVMAESDLDRMIRAAREAGA